MIALKIMHCTEMHTYCTRAYNTVQYVYCDRNCNVQRITKCPSEEQRKRMVDAFVGADILGCDKDGAYRVRRPLPYLK